MIVATTERLIISKVTLQDAPFYFELMNTPKWLKFIGDRQIRSVKDAENAIKNGHLKSYKTHGFGFYKVLLAGSNTCIGTAGLVKRDELDDVDIGFGFLPDYEGKGYGYEASLAILTLARETFNIDKIAAITDPDNTNSIKLLEKLGLEYKKRIKPFEEDKELLLFAKML